MTAWRNSDSMHLSICEALITFDRHKHIMKFSNARLT